jgi:hypothetical protein
MGLWGHDFMDFLFVKKDNSGMSIIIEDVYSWMRDTHEFHEN